MTCVRSVEIEMISNFILFLCVCPDRRLMSAEEWSEITQEILNLELLGSGLVATRKSPNYREKSDTVEENNVDAQNDEETVAISDSFKPIVKSIEKVQSPLKQRMTLNFDEQKSAKSMGVTNFSKINDALAKNDKGPDNKVSVSGGSNDLNKDEIASIKNLFRGVMAVVIKSNVNIVHSVKGLLTQIEIDRKNDRLEVERYRKNSDYQASQFVAMMKDVKGFLAQYECDDESEQENNDVINSETKEKVNDEFLHKQVNKDLISFK